MTTKQTLLDSPPVLQNPTPHSVTVTWAVNGPATGWVAGGGPDLEQATLIRGYANNSLLEVVAKDLNQKELGRWEFSPREK